MDDFEEIVSGLAFDDPNVTAVTSLSNSELLNRYSYVVRELSLKGEVLRQHSDEGRELQSERAALLIELRRRKLGYR